MGLNYLPNPLIVEICDFLGDVEVGDGFRIIKVAVSCITPSKTIHIIPVRLPSSLGEFRFLEKTSAEAVLESLRVVVTEFFPVSAITTVWSKNHAPQNGGLQKVCINSVSPKLGL